MKVRLSDILNNCAVRELIGPSDRLIAAITFDSREVRKDGVFVAVKGTRTDGHLYIDKAIDFGATAIVCECLPGNLHPDCTYVLVENAAYALAYLAANFYGNPSHKLKLIGVTGTNGKTTVATLLYRLFTASGYCCGLFSTIENRIGDKVLAATHTTPDALAMNSQLAGMAEAGCTYVFMEVSSHAIDQLRVAGLRFAGGVFTNLTHDHLDYHGNFANYRNAKKLFFDTLSQDAFALTNADDRNGLFMLQNTRAKKYTYALLSDADFRCRVVENVFEGLVLSLNGLEVHTRLIGRFNASNLAAIYGAALLAGLSDEDALRGISLLTSAEGRFEVSRSADGIIGIVDYAHTPDALLNVLNTINEIRTHNEQLITVAGAGGDRDRTKRPEMAKIAAELSDRLILTSDNPRSEEPGLIIDEMRAGVQPQHYNRTLSVCDRREAIAVAVAMAKPGDIILIAGKGHEKYQEIKGVKYPFDDTKELIERLEKR